MIKIPRHIGVKRWSGYQPIENMPLPKFISPHFVTKVEEKKKTTKFK